MLKRIYLKEMKDCFRDRRTLILTVLLPIAMMTGLLFFYENLASSGEGETYTLAISNTITANEEQIFNDFENIILVKSLSPEETVQSGEAQAALVLTPEFTNLIQKGEHAEATIIGDSFSRKSSTLMDLVMTALLYYEKEIVSDRLQQEGINLEVTQPFTVLKREVADEDPSINLIAMLIPLILGLAIGIGASPAAADLFAGEKEKKTMEALLMTPVNRGTLVFAKWLTITSLGVLTGMITLLVVAIEIQFFTTNLKMAGSFTDNALQVILFAVIVSVIYAMFVASLLMITSIIGKSVKEAQSYSTPVMMLIIFPVMIVSSIGVNELSFTHFVIPMMNIFSLLKELIFGIIDYSHILLTIGSNLVFMIIFFIIGRILFLKDKWVMN